MYSDLVTCCISLSTVVLSTKFEIIFLQQNRAI
jgi:hypothetical protein